jgi:tyrosine-protein kinase Etk/Wzc
MSNDFPSPPTEVSNDVHILDLLLVCARHQRLLFLFPLFATLLALATTLSQTNIYTAKTTFLTPAIVGNGSSLNVMLSQLPGQLNPFVGVRNHTDQWIGLLKSRTLCEKLVTRFNLAARYETPSREAAYAQLQNKSQFTPDKGGFITVEVDDPDPQFAADLANAYIEELQNLSNNLALTNAATQRKHFEIHLARAHENLGKAEQAAGQALRDTGVSSTQIQGKAMVDASATLMAQIAAKNVQIQALHAIATDNNPDMLQLKRERAALQSELAKIEGNRTLPPIEAPSATDQALPPAIDNLRRLRNLKYSETLVELIAQQYQIALLNESNEPLLIDVVDTAIAPEHKSKPKRAQITALAFLVSVFFSVLLAFALEAIERARKDPMQGAKFKAIRDLLRYPRRGVRDRA